MVAFILVYLVLLLGLLWGWEIRKRKSLEQEFVKKKNEVCSVKEFSDTILYNVDAYIILVDRNFLVEKTNYYNLNNTSEGQVLRRVGELLRCKNGLDAGACGSHENCKVCPVRNSIEKCFREKGHFSPLETPMRLYMSEKMDNYVDCIVCVSGTYLQLDQDDKVLLTVRDVTRQKKILDELEEARRNAEWAGEQKTAFLANMSHEIRTPLNAIVGFAGLLGTASDQDRISYVEIIKGNTNMLLQLVNDILDMSKIEAGTLEFIYTDVDVNQIMRELEGIFRLRLEEVLQWTIGKNVLNAEPSKKYLYDKVVYDSPLEKENIMNEVDHVIVYGKIPQKSICIPNITNDLYSPDFIYVVQRADGKKELNIVIETKDIPNDEAKRTVEDAKINNAERFFQQLKIDGYEVKFCRQLQNKKMANIISELLEEDASNPV